MQPDYPAAHSMDAEWFAIDADGHVALFDSGENGHAPEGAAEDGGWNVREARAKELSIVPLSDDFRQQGMHDAGMGLYLYEYNEEFDPIGLFLRAGMPAEPITADQLPPEFAGKGFRLPVRFAECGTIQPLEFYRCNYWYSDSREGFVAGDGQTVLALDGEESFVGRAFSGRSWAVVTGDRAGESRRGIPEAATVGVAAALGAVGDGTPLSVTATRTDGESPTVGLLATAAVYGAWSAVEFSPCDRTTGLMCKYIAPMKTAVGLADRLNDVLSGATWSGGLDSAWYSRTVRMLLREVARNHRYDLLPVLADALAEAGCDDKAILDHCRHGGPHFAGCWVLTLFTGPKPGG